MLPKARRLHKEKDIKTLFARGKSVFGLLVGVKYLKREDGPSTFAVIVGTKVSKKAVVRNRLRRQVRAIVEKRLSEFQDGYDVAFIVREGSVGKKSEELERQIMTSLKKTPLV